MQAKKQRMRDRAQLAREREEFEERRRAQLRAIRGPERPWEGVGRRGERDEWWGEEYRGDGIQDDMNYNDMANDTGVIVDPGVSQVPWLRDNATGRVDRERAYTDEQGSEVMGKGERREAMQRMVMPWEDGYEERRRRRSSERTEGQVKREHAESGTRRDPQKRTSMGSPDVKVRGAEEAGLPVWLREGRQQEKPKAKQGKDPGGIGKSRSVESSRMRQRREMHSMPWEARAPEGSQPKRQENRTRDVHPRRSRQPAVPLPVPDLPENLAARLVNPKHAEDWWTDDDLPASSV